MEDTLTLKIAPDLCDIHFNKWTLSTVFNGLHISYKVKRTRYSPHTCKKALQTAIALASKTWQIENALNHAGIVGTLTVKQHGQR